MRLTEPEPGAPADPAQAKPRAPHGLAWAGAFALLLPALAAAQSPPVTLKLEREFGAAARGDDSARPIFAEGERIETEGERLIIEGDASVRRGDTRIGSSRIEYDRGTEELSAEGGVSISRAGALFTGPSLKLNLGSSTGVFESPSYELSTSGGRGTADRVVFEGEGRSVLEGATYSTCPCDAEDWYLRADTLTLDNEENEGQGRNASLHFRGLKLFTLPVFWFPLSDERRSGFLPPSLALTNRTGAELEVPYYWNIAPNYDMTWTPRIMSRRGLQVGGHFRYLQPDYDGDLRGEVNPNDWVNSETRFQWSLQHRIRELAGWRGVLDLNGISDDEYFLDYGRSIIATSERNLPRDLLLTRGWGPWQVLFRATQYRSILDARDAPPYQRLPQLRLTNTVRNWRGMDVSTLIDATYFTRRLDDAIEGLRVVVNPRISYPIRRPGWFVEPRLSVHASAYRLDSNPGAETGINRALPTFEVDSGLVFERDTRFLGRPMVQTLEPRLYYAWTPYRDQSDIPIFDSGVTEFGFGQLFSPNLFVGHDRIADVNQLTAAVVSRMIDPGSGAEQFRFAIGQRLYFTSQRVEFPGLVARTDRRSDVLLAAAGELGGGISFDSGVQISLVDTRVPRLSLTMRYRPGDDRILNFGARYQRGELGQIDTSFQWPLNRRWTLMGRFNYSWLDQQINEVGELEPTRPGVIEALIGAQYSSDCWATRLAVQRFVTAENQRTTAFFLQFEFSGLGRIGTDPLTILRRNIPGFRVPRSLDETTDRYIDYR